MALATEGVLKPAREVARTNGQTYFLTFTTHERTPFFRNERWALPLLNSLQRYADAGEYMLHDFVIMYDHVHLLLTPSGALERTAQLIKGGFSFQSKRALAWEGAIWQTGFSDHRIRDEGDWDMYVGYISKNVSSLRVEGYTFCGRAGRLILASAPQWLKPLE